MNLMKKIHNFDLYSNELFDLSTKSYVSLQFDHARYLNKELSLGLIVKFLLSDP